MERKSRMQVIDTIRGLTIVSMILYHLCWDLTYKGLMDQSSLFSLPAVLWQKSICCSFILISGFCFPFGRHQLKRSLIITGLSVLITAVTVIFLPDERIIFGVLTLLGLSGLITAGLSALFLRIRTKKQSACPGAGQSSAPSSGGRCVKYILPLVTLALFILTFDINQGHLGFFTFKVTLPQSLFHGHFMTLLGFMDPEFYSTDYFSLIPWYFLYLTGLFLNRAISDTKAVKYLYCPHNPFSYLGRHSLIIYMLHQPILFALVSLL